MYSVRTLSVQPLPMYHLKAHLFYIRGIHKSCHAMQHDWYQHEKDKSRDFSEDSSLIRLF